MFNTTLSFTGDRELDVEMTTVSLSASRFIDERWTLRGSVGVIIDGELKRGSRTIAEVEPGGLLAVGFDYRASEGDRYAPYVDLSGYFGLTWTNTTSPDVDGETGYSASDLRFGARAGWDIAGNIAPYIAGRVFGGPVQWELDGDDVTGSDIHHYQLAVGAAVPVGGIALYAEWAGLGEEALSAGLSASW